MKILILVCVALAGCADYMAGYNHAKYGTPYPPTVDDQLREHQAYDAEHGIGPTTLDDVNNSIQELKEQQQDEIP